jgi:xanthine dehydrogenase accessory factor
MREINDIIHASLLAGKSGKKTALATLVHLDGSSYRRPGARMLIDDDGQLTGVISGGCLEGDALRKALLVIARQYSKLVTYDTTDEEDISVGVQLGCAGVIQVLFEPIAADKKINPVALLQKAVARRQKSVIVTLFSMDAKGSEQIGTCLLLEEDQSITGDIPVEHLKAAILTDAHAVLESKTSLFKNYITNNLTITAFIEFLQPPVSLVVAGAGNDAISLVNIAGSLGWETRVVDGRNSHARPERFLSACQVLVSKPGKVLEKVPVDEQTAFVIMTHNYKYDLAMLKTLLDRDVSYIGLLGPKKKLQRMLDELKAQGMHLSPKQLNKIYGPVGLDIGAETAEEIALSIVAEIKAVFAGKQGMSLRDGNDFIHAREENIAGNNMIPI